MKMNPLEASTYHDALRSSLENDFRPTDTALVFRAYGILEELHAQRGSYYLAWQIELTGTVRSVFAAYLEHRLELAKSPAGPGKDQTLQVLEEARKKARIVAIKITTLGTAKIL